MNIGLRGTSPDIAGQFSGPAIVLGRAPGWVDELDAAFSLTAHEAPVFGVNAFDDAHFQGLDVEHVVSVHCAHFPAVDKRRCGTLYHGIKPLPRCPNADVFWPMPGIGGSGSSALVAVLIALNMGFAPVYVVGVHLDEVTSVDDGQGHKTVHSYRVYRDGWTCLRNQLVGRVFSLSPQGTFLRDLLGGA